MHRIDNATSAAALPTPQPVGPNPNGFYQPQTIVAADWLNSIQEEVANVIESESIVLNKTLRNQLLDAITTKIINAATNRGALVYNSTTQSVPNSVLTAITWDTELQNTDAVHSTSVNTDRMTVPAGVTEVELSANLNFLTNTTGTRQLVLHKNGAAFLGGPNLAVSANQSLQTVLNIKSPVLQVVPGDYFSVFAYQNSGVALNVGTAGGIGSWFSMKITSR